MATSIWGSNGGVAATPAATNRIPTDISSGGAPNHHTLQQLADLGASIGVTTQALGSINTNTTITWSSGSYVTATITGSLTFTFAGAPSTGQGFQGTLVLTNGGSAAITWPGSVTWMGGTAPTLTASGVNVLYFITSNGGTNWYGWTEYDEQSYDASAITSGTFDAGRMATFTKQRWFGAGELIPRITNGAGIDGEELATNDINIDYLAFDAATSEGAQVAFAWPSGFTTFTATFHWTAASGSGTVTWTAAARCYADDDALDQAPGTAQSVTDTLLAANDAHKSAATSAVTPAGTVASGNLTVVQITRDIADTLAVDARLIGVMLEFA